MISRRNATRFISLAAVLALVVSVDTGYALDEDKGKSDTGKKADTGKADSDAGKVEAYKASRVVMPDGEDIAPGIVIVRDGSVESVLKDGEKLPDGAELTDFGDAVIVPGLVDPLSAITQGRGGGRASQSNGSPSDGRRLQGHTGLNLKSTVLRRIGRTGYTSFAIVPNRASGMIAGQASVIRPSTGEEKEAKELVLAESSYLLLGFSSGKSWYDGGVKYLKKAADGIIKEREAKKKAAEDAKKKAAEEKKKAEEAKKKPPKPPKPKPKPKPKPPSPKPPSRRPVPGSPPAAKPATPKKPAAPKPPDPLVQVFKGEKKAFLRCNSPADFEHLFSFLDSLPIQIKFVLVTGPQTPETVDRLAKRRKQIEAVIVEPRMGTWWETSIWVNTARLFLEKGFEVAFVPNEDSVDGHREVFFHLASMVKSGVLPREAMRGVTTVPARLLGLEGKIGVLGKGSRADFAVYDSDPLAGNARLVSVYVSGRRVFHDDLKTGEISGEAVR
jgi:imidazolonepropionase-like amidohydrolase